MSGKLIRFAWFVVLSATCVAFAGPATAQTSAPASAQAGVEWGKKNNVPLVEWMVDEPRENPNPWNRNLTDTIAYCDLAGKVEGAVRMVTPMGDSGAGKDYTVLLDHVEIIDTHANKTSEKLMTRAMKDAKPELWVYNTGADRYSNGFYIWRIGSGGKHEWHFSEWILGSSTPKYLGRDVHNPFILYEYDPYSVSAPPSYPGALLVQEGFITMHDGAMDYRYLHALDQAIAKAEKANEKPDVVAQAKAYQEMLRKSISPIPTVENMASEADLAGLGSGIVEGFKKPIDEWRAQAAELIQKLEGAGE